MPLAPENWCKRGLVGRIKDQNWCKRCPIAGIKDQESRRPVSFYGGGGCGALIRWHYSREGRYGGRWAGIKCGARDDPRVKHGGVGEKKF